MVNFGLNTGREIKMIETRPTKMRRGRPPTRNPEAIAQYWEWKQRVNEYTDERLMRAGLLPDLADTINAIKRVRCESCRATYTVSFPRNWPDRFASALLKRMYPECGVPPQHPVWEEVELHPVDFARFVKGETWQKTPWEDYRERLK